MILLPIASDNRIRRTPWVNYALITTNVAVFLLTWPVVGGHMPALAGLTDELTLWGQSPQPYQFVTSVFLHAGLWHLAGNMIFLWVFGNSLNQKLGHFAYLVFYLACGLAAGIGFVLLKSTPVVGASGAVFGVAGGYLVLFPLSRVTMLYWIVFFVGFLEFSGLAVIGYFILINVLYVMFGDTLGGARVAYEAHLAGAAFGLAAMLLLLAVGAVGRSQFDLLALIGRYRRRKEFRESVGLWEDRVRRRVGKPVESQELASRTGEQVDPIGKLRLAVADALRAGNADRAGELYRQLRQLDPEHVLAQGQQLELANQLTGAGRHELAADAYEAFLRHYPTYESSEQVELLLGLIFGRYLNNPVRARDYLTRCRDRLRDPNQRAMCDKELAKVRTALGED